MSESAANVKTETPFEMGQRVGRLDALIYGHKYGTSIVDGRDDDYARGYRAGYAAYHAERERVGKRNRVGKRGAANSDPSQAEPCEARRGLARAGMGRT